MGATAKDVLDVMRSWLGKNETNGGSREIIDLYNSHKPLARGYAVKYNDEWCDACVSAAAIAAGAVDLIGTECGCEEHVKIFQKKGIWIEDGRITPLPGDIIVYNWETSTQPNDGYSDHIGYVESVSGSTITTIEGNKGDAVARRTLSVGNGNIRGYARPNYDSRDTAKKDFLCEGDQGEAVKVYQKNLIYVGYDCGSGGADGDFGPDTKKATIQFQKDHGLEKDGNAGPATQAKLDAEVLKQKNLQKGFTRFVGKAAAKLAVHEKALKKSDPIKEYSQINKGDLVDVLGQAGYEENWYKVCVADKYIGYVWADSIKKV